MQYSQETYKLLLIPSVTIGLGYCFYFIHGKFSERISKQPYNQLRNSKFFLKQLILTIVLGLAGYFIKQIILFMPFSFLVLFWILNNLTEFISGKPIIFGTRWNAPKMKRWSSGFNTFLILMLSFGLTIGIALATGIAKTSNKQSVLIDLKNWE